MRIFFKQLVGNMITLDVDPSDLIETLNAKLHKQEGIPSEHQWLIFGGEHLMVGKTVAEYNIKADSILYLIQVI